MHLNLTRFNSAGAKAELSGPRVSVVLSKQVKTCPMAGFNLMHQTSIRRSFQWLSKSPPNFGPCAQIFEVQQAPCKAENDEEELVRATHHKCMASQDLQGCQNIHLRASQARSRMTLSVIVFVKNIEALKAPSDIDSRRGDSVKIIKRGRRIGSALRSPLTLVVPFLFFSAFSGLWPMAYIIPSCP